MTREDVREKLFSHLQAHGKATNLDPIDRLDGDKNLFQRVRQTLILDDPVRDHEDIGLVYIGLESGDNADPPTTKLSAP